MSDDNRKGFLQKAKEAIIPDASKSEGEKAKEGLTGAADKVAGAVQPDETKGTAQRVKDNF